MKKIIKWGLIGFVVLIVIGVIASAGSSQPQKVGSTNNTTNSQATSVPKTQTFKMGDKVNLNGKTLTVNSVKPYVAQNQFMQPKSGDKFVAVDILIKNDSNDPFDYNVYDFKLQDSQTYDYQQALTDIQPTISSGTIQPGQSTRGFITFEIPSGNDPSELIYTPGFLNSSQIIIGLK